MKPFTNSNLFNVFFENYGVVKFVCLGDEYRFTNVFTDHCTLLTEGEKAVSAGFVAYNKADGMFKVTSSTSMTLKIGPRMEDSANIAQILGWKAKETN